MAKKESLLEELNWVTEKISSEIWILNFGTLGTTWALLIASDNIKYRLSAADVRWIFFLSIAALVCELLQHFSGYLNARLILGRMETENRTEFQYDQSALLYKARIVFFYLKIALTIVAAIFLLHALYFKIYMP